MKELVSPAKLITYNCTTCQKEVSRLVNWISPAKFADKPIMKITEWCPICTISNTITVKFIEYTKTIKVISVQNTSNIIIVEEEKE